MTLISRLFNRRQPPGCELSIVVIAYDMARELPRTLHSLSRNYQQNLAGLDYEVLVVDNGSPEPISGEMVASHGKEFRLIRIDDASPSPGAAVNMAAGQARGKQLGIIVDGARVLSPGVLSWASLASRTWSTAVVSVLGFHLGPEQQRFSSRRGYNQQREDQLLDRIAWPEDGYRLFEIASLAGSSRYGWQGPIAESNCLFMPAQLFKKLGGYDVRFASPGGGLINLDFYKRACEADGVELVYLVGEGCFHQIHGGVTTGDAEVIAASFDSLGNEYVSIRGCEYQAPLLQPLLLGRSHPAASLLVAEGGRAAAQEARLQRTRHEHLQATDLIYEAIDDAKKQ